MAHPISTDAYRRTSTGRRITPDEHRISSMGSPNSSEKHRNSSIGDPITVDEHPITVDAQWSSSVGNQNTVDAHRHAVDAHQTRVDERWNSSPARPNRVNPHPTDQRAIRTPPERSASASARDRREPNRLFAVPRQARKRIDQPTFPFFRPPHAPIPRG
jgi:hypothetical protein